MILTNETKTIYSDIYQDVPFEIHKRQVEGISSDAWTFYIFLHEQKFSRFDELWLEPKVLNEYSKPYITYDYNSIYAAQIEGWNGGVTYYRKHGEVPGYRCVELGCDYQHYWDTNQSYQLSDIHIDVLTTINNLVPFFNVLTKPKSNC